MAYINVPGKLKTKGYEGLADADQIAYSTIVDEDDETVVDKTVKDILDSQALSITDVTTLVTSIQNALDNTKVDDEVTVESVTALSQKIDNVDTKVASMFVCLTLSEYDALETKQDGVLYLIKQEETTEA